MNKHEAGGKKVETIKWLSIAGRYTKMYLDKQLEPLGLNSSQHMFVIKICEEPGISQERLFSLIYLNPSNITRAITALEKQGFLVKRQNPADRRTFILDPTEKARQTYPEIVKIAGGWYEMALEGFTEEEKALFDSLAKKAGNNLLKEMCEEKEERKKEAP